MEASSWKHQLAVASLVAVLASFVLRFLIPGFFSTPGLPGPDGGAFAVGFFVILFVFFLPFLWWRTTVGYLGALIVGILSLVGQTNGLAGLADAGELSVQILYGLYIPAYVFMLLLIGSSVLAWREG